jgi:hypothetical protein
MWGPWSPKADARHPLPSILPQGFTLGSPETRVQHNQPSHPKAGQTRALGIDSHHEISLAANQVTSFLFTNMNQPPRTIKQQVSGIFLTVSAVLLLSSAFLLSVPGDYWRWFVVAGFFSVPPVILGPGRYRLWGFVTLALAGLLMLSDFSAGRHYQEKRQRLLLQHMQQANATGNSTNTPLVYPLTPAAQ